MSSSLDELLTAEFKEAFDEFDKVKHVVESSKHFHKNNIRKGAKFSEKL